MKKRCRVGKANIYQMFSKIHFYWRTYRIDFMKKAFTLIELLLVMMILGTILGMVLHKKIINYKKVYNGYQKKATEDVINATNLVFYRYPSLRNFETLIDGPNWNQKINNANLNSGCRNVGTTPDTCIRAFYKSALKGKECDTLADCRLNINFHTCENTYAEYNAMPSATPYVSNDCNDTDIEGNPNSKLSYPNPNFDSNIAVDPVNNPLLISWNQPSMGIRMKNGEVIMFSVKNAICNADNPDCFMVFVDMNGAKGPNLYGQDRYRFFVDYQNNVKHEDNSDLAYINPNGLSDEEVKILDEMRNLAVVCNAKKSSDTGYTVCQNFLSCYNKYPADVLAKSQVEACQCKCYAAGGQEHCKENDSKCE